MFQLIIIRGNSGSGKSSIARTLRTILSGKTALIERDYFRRIVLKEKDSFQERDILEFLLQSTQFATSRGYTVILEGILSPRKYRPMLLNLTSQVSSMAIYLDGSFEETLRRHQTKSNCHEFGYLEMKEWFVDKDYLNVPNEIVISENSSLQESVGTILAELKYSDHH